MHSYICRTNTTSPGPTQVQNMEVEEFEKMGLSMLRVRMTWSPPRQANGILQLYKVCLSTLPLVGNLDISIQLLARSTCKDYQVSLHISILALVVTSNRA